MADKKISDENAGSTPSAGNTTLLAVQGGANVKLTDAQIAAGVAATYGLAKNNVTTTDPGASNDSTQGYSAGSIWFNTTRGIAWFCRSASSGAAVWDALNPRVGAYRSQTWITAPHSIGGATTAANPVSNGFMCAVPVEIRERVTFDAMGVFTDTLASSTACKMGIYSWAAGVPGTKLYEGNPASPAATTTTGAEATQPFVSNPTLDPGLYFFVGGFNGAPTLRAIAATDTAPAGLLGTAAMVRQNSGSSNVTGFSGTFTYASHLPSSFGTATEINGVTALIHAKVA